MCHNIINGHFYRVLHCDTFIGAVFQRLPIVKIIYLRDKTLHIASHIWLVLETKAIEFKKAFFPLQPLMPQSMKI